MHTAQQFVIIRFNQHFIIQWSTSTATSWLILASCNHKGHYKEYRNKNVPELNEYYSITSMGLVLLFIQPLPPPLPHSSSCRSSYTLMCDESVVFQGAATSLLWTMDNRVDRDQNHKDKINKPELFMFVTQITWPTHFSTLSILAIQSTIKQDVQLFVGCTPLYYNL